MPCFHIFDTALVPYASLCQLVILRQVLAVCFGSRVATAIDCWPSRPLGNLTQSTLSLSLDITGPTTGRLVQISPRHRQILQKLNVCFHQIECVYQVKMATDFGAGAPDGASLALHFPAEIHPTDQQAEIARLSLGHDAEPGSRPAPELNMKGVVAVDITKKFSQASQGESSPCSNSAYRC